jgi:hypothetical protein
LGSGEQEKLLGSGEPGKEDPTDDMSVTDVGDDAERSESSSEFEDRDDTDEPGFGKISGAL